MLCCESCSLDIQEVEVKVLRWLHEEEATGIQYLEVTLPFLPDFTLAEMLPSRSRPGFGLHALQPCMSLSLSLASCSPFVSRDV